MAPQTKNDRYLILQRLSSTENALLGMFAGAVEAIATQPLTYLKTAKQQGLAITANPRLLYRGVTISAGNDASMVGLQFLFTGMLHKVITGGRERELSIKEEVGASMLSGAISGVPITFFELTMIQQQRFGGTLLATPLRVLQETGSVGWFRGGYATIAREAISCAGYLGVSPLLQSRLVENDTFCNLAHGNATVANIIASSIAGVSAAWISHPFDTIKSCMQGDIERRQYNGFMDTSREIFRRRGLSGFFDGFTARAAMIVLCFMIFNEVKLQLAPVIPSVQKRQALAL